MKTKYTVFLLIASLCCFTFNSCNNNEYKPIEDAAYIAQTATQANFSKKIKITDSDVKTDLNVKLSTPTSKDIEFTIVADSAVLNKYNKHNNTTLALLPQDFYTISKPNIKVTKGTSLSDAIPIVIKPLTQEMIDKGLTYAIPVKLHTNSYCGKVLNGADELVYILEPTIITSCPVLGTYRGKNNLNYYASGVASRESEYELNSWTVEMRVNMSNFYINNQALFGTWGSNSEIYIRFGDAGTPLNTLQVKFGSAGQFDKSNTRFTPNTWYHIAVVYDGSKCTLYVNGQKDLDTDKPAGKTFRLGKTINITSSGRNYWTASCMMSEVRVWEVARTQQQLIDNEYNVNPNTPGLLHYWKMNDGKGDVLKDYAPKAPADVKVTLQKLGGGANNQLLWLDNIRSDGKGRTSVN